MKFFKKYFRHILIGLLCGFLNGLFGAGGGSVVVPATEKFLGIDEKKSHSTAIAIILLMSLASSYLYVSRGFFDFNLWVPVTVGGIFGGVAGAKLLLKIPKKHLKIIFGSVIVATAVKMIV